jgi:hypothetical protein
MLLLTAGAAPSTGTTFISALIKIHQLVQMLTKRYMHGHNTTCPSFLINKEIRLKIVILHKFI